MTLCASTIDVHLPIIHMPMAFMTSAAVVSVRQRESWSRLCEREPAVTCGLLLKACRPCCRARGLAAMEDDWSVKSGGGVSRGGQAGLTVVHVGRSSDGTEAVASDAHQLSARSRSGSVALGQRRPGCNGARGCC
jgi:hypothetical protein